MATTGVVPDLDWGCEHSHGMSAAPGMNIYCCVALVKSTQAMAKALSDRVIDSSWITKLDPGTQLQYRKTAADTANLLQAIFSKAVQNPLIEKDFGELMVSMGAARSLAKLFEHTELPLAELWKSKLKQNDGFDFHTTCPNELLHFGEAKYSSKSSPYMDALNQIAEFIRDEKHFRDLVYLRDLTSSAAINSLKAESFGVAAAFSLHAKSADLVMANALKKAIEFSKGKAIKNIFLIGVLQ